MVKYKEVLVHNADLIRPSEVIKQGKAGLGNPEITCAGQPVDKFNFDTHIRCWKRYKVRPPSNSPDPKQTDKKYCFYDELNGNYGDTPR